MVTAVIGDVASYFGCTLGIKDSVTAVAFVALGTSIPGKLPRSSARENARGAPTSQPLLSSGSPEIPPWNFLHDGITAGDKFLLLSMASRGGTISANYARVVSNTRALRAAKDIAIASLRISRQLAHYFTPRPGSRLSANDPPFLRNAKNFMPKD